ncbi:hypothetical protein JW823_02260 [bacterium]|nr:hypothetical protein [candidate division CSSED10-310 bacterium]
MLKSEGESLIESFDELSSGLERLSNHFQKYKQLVEQNAPALRQRLEERGMAGKVHLWRKSYNYKSQMTAVARVADTPKEMRQFIGTYFGLQMLHLHFISIESLRRESRSEKDRTHVYRQILSRLRIQRRSLISNYISVLIHVFAEDLPMNGIAICNVGMIMDQEDLDVGVFISPGIDKNQWNTIISQVAAEFLKYSTKMHFYLAELVTTNSYLTSTVDFQRYLKRDISNYILISELLANEYLLGDKQPVRRLEEVVINKFYYNPDARYLHEAYLRGLMGEVQRQMQRKIDPQWASPKNDALRLIHNSMSLLKTIYGIHEHGSRDTLDILVNRDPGSRKLYEALQSSFNFCEMFFYLYQLLISIDDRFDTTDPVIMENLDAVAEVMGFESLGPIRPGPRLLVHYYENLNLLCELSGQVMSKVDSHLKKITVFNDLMNNKKPPELAIKWTDSLVRNLFFAIKQFKGTRYWDDILQSMEGDKGRRLAQLVESIEKLSIHHRLYTFRRLIRMIAFDMDSMISMAVLFNRHVHGFTEVDYSRALNIWLLELFKTDLHRVRELVEMLPSNPSIVTHFLINLDQQQLSDVSREVEKIDDTSKDFQKLQGQFKILCRVLELSSNNYRRFFSKVVEIRPEIVSHIDDMAYLDRVRQLQWAELSDASNPQELKERLAVFYQFGFCRCGLEVLNRPDDLESFYRMYHSFFRRYFRWLYRAAQWQIDTRGEYQFEFRAQDEDDQPIAIFCTGGYAREEAFENDIDLFVICGISEREFIRYASSLINDINRELNKQGVLTHHRFAEIFNSFIIPMDQLEAKFEIPEESDFIDWTQLLGARLLVGSQSFDRVLTRLLEKKLFANPHRFIASLLNEIEDRRITSSKIKSHTVNVKENPGGLRDIQMILQAGQAFIGNRESDIWRTFQTLINALPELASEFKTLERVYKFLRTFKDLYYLSFSTEDDMLRDQLIRVSEQMGIDSMEGDGSGGSAPRLINSYRGHRYRARQAIDTIGRYLLEQSRGCL